MRLGWATVIATGAGKAAARVRTAGRAPAGSGAAASDDGDFGTEGHRARCGFQLADRTDDGRAGTSGCAQHDRLQQPGPRSLAAGAGGAARRPPRELRSARKGIREFIVGTGGETLDTVVAAPTLVHRLDGIFNQQNFEASTGNYWGAMALTLNPNGYKSDYESALKCPGDVPAGLQRLTATRASAPATRPVQAGNCQFVFAT